MFNDQQPSQKKIPRDLNKKHTQLSKYSYTSCAHVILNDCLTWSHPFNPNTNISHIAHGLLGRFHPEKNPKR